ncbi:DMT family transporter [Pseudoflavonifractor phocaeensis]|uniref:DMT family transporter n=1 Tax=Pseudoflavonifractor phocaeensis TaxID=1870988 RepID=UPI001F23A78A|nr:DMT family transporter [Pseudoflavonifractor phocaeensis]MCF2660931.1 EamA family transporter [Pseudoflavonifractor phocaeensis]
MEKKAYLKIILAASLWGGIGVFVKILSSLGLTSMQGVAARNLVASAVFFLYLLFTDRPALKIDPRHWYYFFGSGVCGLLFFNWCYFSTISASSMSVAAVLLYTSPVFVMIMSAFLFKEPITPVKVAALAVTFVGCMLSTGLLPLGQTAIAPLTLLSGLGAGFGYALYSILSKAALSKYPASTVSFYTILFCAVLALPISGLYRRTDLLANGTFWMGSLGIGLLCCAVPSLLYTQGLLHAEAGKASIMATAELLVATLLGILIYHEEITPYKLLGMAAIFGAILLLNRPVRTKNT